MSNEDEYEDYSDEDDGDDIHAECLNCGTLNRFPGKDIPKILCYECGEIIEAQPDPPPPAAASNTTSGGSFPPAQTNAPAHQYQPPSSSPAPKPTPVPQTPPAKDKKRGGFFKKKKSKNKQTASFAQGDGNPAISAPVFVKHVSGATQSDDVSQAENGLLVGNRPDPNLPVDVEKKSRAMDIPIGVEQKPLIGGLSSVTAPTNVRRNPDPLSSIQQGGKPKNMSKEEKRVQREKEKMVKKAKKVAEKEAKKFAKSGVVLEKRKFPTQQSPNAAPASPSAASPSPAAASPSPAAPAPAANATPTPAPPTTPTVQESNESEDAGDEDETSEFCSQCGSLNVFPPGADCVACYECDTPIHAPAKNTKPARAESFEENDEDEDEITDVCPSCNTLNAFPSEDVPQIACYNCGSPINNPKGEDAQGGEEGELQACCGACGSLNIFPPGVFAVACWECESPIYYNAEQQNP